MSRQTGIVAVALVVLLAYVAYNTLSTEGPGSRGIASGQEIPPFAAPLALANARCGDEDCDVNLLVKASDGVPKACDVRTPEVINSCELTEQGPLVLAFLADPSSECVEQIDLLDRIAPRFPDVSFAAVGIRGDHADLNDTIRERGWEIPVAYDHDGALANAFAVAVCPTITFADQGGAVSSTTLGTATEAQIVRDIEALE